LDLGKEAVSMSDYAVKITVRNGRILRRMREMGFESQSALARSAGLSLASVNQIIAMKTAPENMKGEFRDPVRNIAAALKCDPEDLFNERQRTLAVEKNTQEIYMDEAQLLQITAPDSMESAAFAKLTVNKLMDGLDERMRDIAMRVSAGETLDDISETYHVTRERIRQIYLKSLRVMKHRARLSDQRANDLMHYGTD